MTEGRCRIRDGFDRIERQAFAICAWPAADDADRAGRRRVTLIFWLALRRRRPRAAAVLSARRALDKRAGSKGRRPAGPPRPATGAAIDHGRCAAAADAVGAATGRFGRIGCMI